MEDFLTRAEIAKILKVSEVTIDRWRKGGMPFIKLKGKVLFEKIKVMEWLNKKSQN